MHMVLLRTKTVIPSFTLYHDYQFISKLLIDLKLSDTQKCEMTKAHLHHGHENQVMPIDSPDRCQDVESGSQQQENNKNKSATINSATTDMTLISNSMQANDEEDIIHYADLTGPLISYPVQSIHFFNSIFLQITSQKGYK